MRLIIGTLLCFFSIVNWAAPEPKAMVFTIDGFVSPAMSDYINRSITDAKKNNVSLIILEINTSGGLDISTHLLNQTILNADIPIVSFVTPHGAKAISAGTEIMYASPVAVMAEGTFIGKATPAYILNSNHQLKKTLSDQEIKRLNNETIYLQSLAMLNHRNIEWAKDSIKYGVSITADQALKLNVINFIATNLSALLQQIDNKTVYVKGKPHKIKADDLEIIRKPPDLRYDLLSVITSPNITYLLILIAIYGLFFELSVPGFIFPGVIGLISLLLVLYAFQIMPVNYAGLTLVLIGITLMIVEVFVLKIGVVGLLAMLSFIVGSLIVFDPHPSYHLAEALIFVMSILSLVFFYILLRLTLKSQKTSISVGREALIGSQARVISIDSEGLKVKVLGKVWDAQSEETLVVGQVVKIVGISKLLLIVQPQGKN